MIRIAANAALSMFWLYARLKSFSLSEVACNVSVVTTDYTSELLSDTHDLALVYCDGNISGWDCVSVVGGELVAAAAPKIAKQAELAGMFSNEQVVDNLPPILEYVNLTPDWINWQVWLNRLGFHDVNAWNAIHCNSYVQSIGKALVGEGVALVNVPMMKEELDSGALVKIGTKGLVPKKSYHLCRKQNVGLSQNAKDLFEFLVEQN